MKRMTFIGSVLLALLLTAAGAGFAFAQEEATPPDVEFKSHFPVTFEGQEGQTVGTVTIDAKNKTYAFKGEGLTPGTTYYLVCAESQLSLGFAEATETGKVRMRGTWEQSFWEGLNATDAPTFVLSTSPTGVVSNACTLQCSWNGCYSYGLTGTQMTVYIDFGTGVANCVAKRVDVYQASTGEYFDHLNTYTFYGTQCGISGRFYFWYHVPEFRYRGDDTVCPCSFVPPFKFLCY